MPPQARWGVLGQQLSSQKCFQLLSTACTDQPPPAQRNSQVANEQTNTIRHTSCPEQGKALPDSRPPVGVHLCSQAMAISCG